MKKSSVFKKFRGAKETSIAARHLKRLCKMVNVKFFCRAALVVGMIIGVKDAWGITPNISVGSYHTCALTPSGGVKCWGRNNAGQIGNGTQTDSSTPVNVSGLSSGMSSVSAGYAHTCAVTTSGGVKCWGLNDFGQLGNGTTTNSTTPVDVSGITGVSSISAGGYHTCAVTSSGAIKCWGRNAYGQLGNGNTTDSTIPVDVNGLTTGVATVSTGNYHTCAVTSSGGVKCWGLNDIGQLGNGTTTNSNTPINVTGLTSGVAAVSSGGYYTCALTTSGGVKSWGNGGDGRLGNGATANSTTPVDVNGLASGVTALSCSEGGAHALVINSSGAALSWGDNDYGSLGNGSTADSSTSVNVSGLTSGLSSISAGGNTSCVLTSSADVKCWGRNDFGQLGDGTTTNNNTPVSTLIDLILPSISASDSPDPFSPEGDTYQDTTTFTLSASDTSGIASYNLKIYADAGKTQLKKTFSGTVNPPASVSWNGKGDDGIQVSNGTYTYVFQACDSASPSNCASTADATITVSAVAMKSGRTDETGTNGGATAYNNGRRIVRDSLGNIHLVYSSWATGEIYYVKSTDNGANWSSPLNLSNNTGNSRYPSIVIDSSNNLYVVWDDNSSGNYEIYYSKYTTSWSTPVNVSNTAGSSYYPSLAIDSNNYLHVVWYDVSGTSEIYYSKYTSSWSTPVNISNTAGSW